MPPGRIVDNDLGRIQKRRRAVRYKLLDGQSMYVTLDDGNFDLLVEGAMKTLKIPKKSELAVRESLIEFAGQSVNERIGDRIALKLAGGFAMLKKGEPVRKFHGLAKPIWAPVEISELRFGRYDRRRHRLYADLLATVTAGPAVGVEIKKRLPMKFVVSVLSRKLCWSLRDPRPAHNELVRMWFNAELIQDPRYGLDIDNFECLPQHKRHNRQLRADRREPCIRRYSFQCHKCPIGYADCQRGTHRYTWLLRSCPECGAEKAPYDPERPDAKVCLSCSSKKARAFWALARRAF